MSDVTGFVGDSVKAFNAQQESISGLTASLRANVPAWNGDTSAIEAVIKAQEKLGFTDTEQRDSLKLLLAATHDVTEAQQIQSVAMDLARFKHIDLATATEALTKVEAGSYRILKGLGIELAKGATQTEALAAVEGVAKGAVEDFAATNEGKLLVSQVKVNDAMEKMGSKIAGPFADGMGTAADAVGVLVDTFSTLGDVAQSIADPIDIGIAQAIKDIIWFNDFVGSIPGPWHKAADAIAYTGATTDNVAGKMADDLGAVSNATHDLQGKTRDDQVAISGSFDKIGKSALQMASDAEATQRRVRAANDLTVTQLKKDANDEITQAFGPIIENHRLAATNAEIAANKVIIASKKSSDGQKAAARDALDQLHMDQANYLVDLSKTGQRTSAAYKTAIAELKTEIARATGPTKGLLQGILDELNAIDTVKATPTVTLKIYGAAALDKVAKDLGYIGNTDLYKKVTAPTPKPKPHRAGGGPMTAGMPYIVGELGTELIVPNADATALTHTASVAAISALGAKAGGDTYQIGVNLPTTARPDPFEVATQLRRLADFGQLTARKP